MNKAHPRGVAFGESMADSTLIDRPGVLRSEDAFDVDAVDGFLKERVAGLAGRPNIAQFPGGASNLTYCLQYPDRDLILRRPPFGAKAKSAHDVLREARVMHALRPVYPHVPDILARSDDHAIIGCDFYVMERLIGIIPRRDFPPGLDLGPERTRKLCRNVLDKLIELHAIEPLAAGLGDLGKGAGYVRRQVEGWNDRWRVASTDDVEPFADVVAWLTRAMPAGEVAIRLIHNDFRFDNVVLAMNDPLRVIGVLDWEMATLGDPLMDLGGALAYWVQADDEPAFRAARRQPTDAPGMFTRAEVVAYYGEKTGLCVETFDFYEVFGLFRLAVIIQQIYKRFALRQTTNERFASYGAMANTLGLRCRAAIARSKL